MSLKNFLKARLSGSRELVVEGIPPERGGQGSSLSSAALLELRNRLQDRGTWIPDAVSSDCYRCQAKFTTIRRKHHCRMCGQIFCSRCCGNFIAGRSLGSAGSIRVCVFCHEYISKNLAMDGGALASGDSPSSSSPSGAAGGVGDPGVSSPLSDPGSDPRRDSVLSTLDLRFVTDDDPAQEAMVVEEEEAALSSESFTLSDPKMLRQLMDRIVRVDGGVPLGTKVYQGGAFHNGFTGAELVDWIRQQDCFITDERSAKVLGQALLNHGYIRTFVDGSGSGVFQSDDVPYRPTPLDELRPLAAPKRALSNQESKVSEGDDSMSPVTEDEDDASFPEWVQYVASTSRQNTLDRKREKSRTRDKSRGRNRSTAGKDRKDGGAKDQAFSVPKDLRRLASEEATSKLTPEDVKTKFFMEGLYRRHAEMVLCKLLKEEQLPASKWLVFIASQAERIADSVNPYATADEVDVRRFVKVKKFPGGKPSDSMYVNGEVFTSCVVRASGCDRYERPKIVLVGGSIRPRGHDDTVGAVASLAYREKEYANAFCSRVLTLAPSVVFVEGYVCRLVRQTLEAEGIEVMCGVKASSLLRISRYFSIPIFRESAAPPGGAEEIVLQTMRAGSCEAVRRMDCSEQAEEDQDREYVFVEGSKAELGGTVILRGGDSDELARVKRVLWKFIPYQKNSKCEPAFLFNCGIDPHIPIKAFSERELSMSPYVRLCCREGPDAYCGDEVTDGTGEDKDVKDKETSSTVKPNERAEKTHDDLHLVNAEEENDVTGSGQEWHSGRLKRLPHYRSDLTHSAIRPPPKGRPREVSTRKSSGKKSPPPPPFTEVSGSSFYVLFSSYDRDSVASPHHCIRPFPFKICFYSTMDLALGKFLDNYVLCDDYNCPNHKICKSHMDTHVRTFCSGSSSIKVNVSQPDEGAFPGYTDSDIVMWKFCPHCKLITGLKVLTGDSYNFSFGMFLILVMYEGSMRRRGSTAEACQHLVNGEHLTCFAKKGKVATFQRGDVVCPQLLLPPKRLSVPEPFVDPETLAEEAKMLGTHGKMVFNAIFDEIKRITVCGIPILEESAGAYLEEHSKSHNEFRELMNTLTAFQERTDYLQEGRALVFKIRKLLCRTVLDWRSLVVALQEKGKKEVNDSRVRKESGTNREGGLGACSSAASLANAAAEACVSKAKVEEVLKPLPKNHDYIYKAPFSDTHHYCLSASQKTVVDESQISTIIAFALNSPEHHAFLNKDDDVDGAKGGSKTMQKRHFHLSFSDESCKFFCCSYFARDFHRLRETVFVPPEQSLEDFSQSLSECQPWDAAGGKSGSAFYKTRDDRFILKEMNSYEANASSFEPFMAGYFDYVHRSVHSEQPSCIAKILGVYKVAVNNFVTGNSYKQDLLVIENLFYGRDIQEKFDLKGSIRNRMVDTSTVADSNLVLWDENLLKTMCDRPLYLSSRENTRMLEAISYDTNFLRSNHMMDYSMLLGITRNRRELVVGIVDYIRAFTWDKKVEQLLKQSGLLGRGDRRQPTCVDPGLYMERFKEAMYKYFITVPDFCFRGVPGGSVEGTRTEELPATSESEKKMEGTAKELGRAK